MKFHHWFLFTLTSILLLGCTKKEQRPEIITTEQEIPKIEVADPIPTEENAFVARVSKLVKSKDTDGLIQLGYWEGAAESVKSSIPFVYKQLTRFENPKVYMEPPGEVLTKTTLPIVGKLVVERNDTTGSGHTKVPVGVKDGKYYFTILAK